MPDILRHLEEVSIEFQGAWVCSRDRSSRFIFFLWLSPAHLSRADDDIRNSFHYLGDDPLEVTIFFEGYAFECTIVPSASEKVPRFWGFREGAYPWHTIKNILSSSSGEGYDTIAFRLASPPIHEHKRFLEAEAIHRAHREENQVQEPDRSKLLTDDGARELRRILETLDPAVRRHYLVHLFNLPLETRHDDIQTLRQLHQNPEHVKQFVLSKLSTQ